MKNQILTAVLAVVCLGTASLAAYAFNKHNSEALVVEYPASAIVRMQIPDIEGELRGPYVVYYPSQDLVAGSFEDISKMMEGRDKELGFLSLLLERRAIEGLEEEWEPLDDTFNFLGRLIDEMLRAPAPGPVYLAYPTIA